MKYLLTPPRRAVWLAAWACACLALPAQAGALDPQRLLALEQEARALGSALQVQGDDLRQVRASQPPAPASWPWGAAGSAAVLVSLLAWRRRPTRHPEPADVVPQRAAAFDPVPHLSERPAPVSAAPGVQAPAAERLHALSSLLHECDLLASVGQCAQAAQLLEDALDGPDAAPLLWLELLALHRACGDATAHAQVRARIGSEASGLLALGTGDSLPPGERVALEGVPAALRRVESAWAGDGIAQVLADVLFAPPGADTPGRDASRELLFLHELAEARTPAQHPGRTDPDVDLDADWLEALQASDVPGPPGTLDIDLGAQDLAPHLATSVRLAGSAAAITMPSPHDADEALDAFDAATGFERRRHLSPGPGVLR